MPSPAEKDALVRFVNTKKADSWTAGNEVVAKADEFEKDYLNGIAATGSRSVALFDQRKIIDQIASRIFNALYGSAPYVLAKAPSMREFDGAAAATALLHFWHGYANILPKAYDAVKRALIRTWAVVYVGWEIKEREITRPMTPAEIVKKSLEIAGDLCIYTNQNHLIETLD